jgi:hypothetical protein
MNALKFLRGGRVGYVAAHAAEVMKPGGFAAERRWQSRWLADRLGLLA